MSFKVVLKQNKDKILFWLSYFYIFLGGLVSFISVSGIIREPYNLPMVFFRLFMLGFVIATIIEPINYLEDKKNEKRKFRCLP